MVRETRHLWIGNLPENVREEQIRDLFQRHGRVQSVKLLSEDTSASAGGSMSGGNGGVRSGKSATVAFIDIRSAAKAFRAVHSMAGQPLDINYHEPGSAPPRCHPPIDSHPSTEAPSDIPVVIGQGSTSNNVGSNQSPGMHNNSIPGPSVYRQQRFPPQHGQSEDSSSHFYDQPKGFSRGRGDGHGYRGRRDRHNNYSRHSFHNNNMDRGYRMSWNYSNESGRVAPPAHSQADERTTGPAQSTHPPVTSEVTKPPRRPDSPASTVSSRHVPSKRHKSRSVSESGSSDRGSTAGSRSRSGSRSSVSTSVSSGRSRSPPHHGSSNHFSRGGSGTVRFHQNSYSRQRYRRSRVTNRPTDSRARHSSRSPVAASPSSSTSSSPSPHRKAATTAPHSPSHSPSSSKSYSPSRGASTTSHHHHQHHRRPPNTAELHAAIKIRNLPIRSSDTSLKDGLYHAYKKHGKVAWVRVIGSGADRYAIVCFKSQEYAAKAVQSSQDKQFFGCKIQVTPYYTGKGEESVGGTDEESRGPGEEESSFPTRTVLITSLDSSVTVSELKSAFDQYGDIVNIDIRKQGSSTHAVCEFLDIASAIRAKWGRHVFKSREARISFFRNPPTNALLLDGTAGVTEKQVTSHCCQYGAIKRVDMDPERFLALVQYEEISSAETAIRELGNWAIKGKKLDIDFASQEVIRRFQERLDPGLSNSSLSICGSSSPSSNPIAALNAGAFKDGTSRKVRSRLGEYLGDEDGMKSGYHSYRNEMDNDSKPMTTAKLLEESSPPSTLNASRISALSGREPHENLNSTVDHHGYKRLEHSTDSQRNAAVCTKSGGKERTEKFSSSGSIKIDLSCHETDSAIVTSSSDIIAVENSDTDVHSNFTGSSASGDEKVGSFEPATKHRKSSSENVSSVLTTTTVDGVSSTSPEPKSEIVSTSADPGVGIGTDSVARYLNDAVATDSQSRVVDCKVRRTSADSGNHLNSSPECNVLHSNQDNDSILSSKPIKKSELVRPTAALTSNSQGTEDSDDRPGTPLCDENPEGFEAPALSPSVKSDSAVPPTRSKPEPTNPTEVLKVATKQSSTTSVKDPKSSSSNSSSSCSGNTAKKVVSPTISPSSGATSSVMLSSTNDTSIFSPFNESSEIPAYSRTSTNVFENSSTPSQFCVAKKELKIDDLSCGAVSSEVNTEQVTSVQEVKDKPNIVENDESASGTGFSSDSEGGLSPRHSPTTDSLEQRVKNICEKFDTWDGNRKILKHTPVSHSHLLSNSSIQDVNESTGNKPDSLIDKIKQTIPHFTGPSDIGRTVLAKKTIFDEDCERLVNYSEKYETKPSTLLTATTNWKLPTLSRSTSCSSTSSAPFLGQTSPLAVSSNCMPPLSSPVCISPVSGSFNGTPSSKPHTPVCSSPNYSPSLSSMIVGKNAPEKVKDLNANVTPHLNRSSGQVVQKSFSTPSSSKPSTSLGVSISSSGCTKLSSSPPSLPLVKASTDTLTTTPSVAEVTKQELGSAVAKKVSNIQPLTHTPMTSALSAQALNMVTTTATSPSPVVQNSGTRAMERSLSLESRKNSPAAPSGFQSSFPSNGPGVHLPETPTSADSARSVTPRRISVENLNSTSSSSSLDSKQNLQIPSEKSNNAAPGTPETSRDKPSSVSGTDAHAHAHHSFREKMQPKEAAVPSSKSVHPMNTLTSKKNEMTSLKDEISAKVQPVHQETTVAVVATVQTPLLTSRNEVISTSSSKENSKKDKDKKRRSSGGSTPVSSGGGGHQSGSSSMKSDSHSNQGGSTSSSRSSGKDKEERSSRKEKDPKVDTSTKSADSCKNEDSQAHHSSSSSHHKKEKRDKEKDHRENSGDRSTFTTSTSKDSHSHKRDRESKDSSKTKRRLSSQENDQERKKAKVEKDSEQTGHHHHRSKGSESKDARESTKDSSIAKDKMSSKDRSEKESSSKSEKSSSSGPTKESSSNPESKREKSDGKERDHHHKSKSSGSSSSSKHHSSNSSSHHQVQKSRSSTDGHSSSSTHKLDSSGMKDSYKKDKEKEKEKEKFSGKENSASKSLSKHHSHAGHSGSSSSKSKETSSKSNKSSRKEREREKPRQERHPSSLDSDVDENDVQNPSLNLLEHSGERRSESKSERSEKRDSEGKRDRHKSGGGDSLSGMGDSDKSKSRKKEPKKRRRLVVEESGSSDSDGPVNLLDDEEEEKKHHSIFDVVIDYSDYYVSMYDKVKRSNRACKNITAQQKQQEEEKRKQDKVSESFKQLKQSRAKREEKKRSTSIEERKSMTNSSSDEGSHIDAMNDFDLEHRRSHHDRQSEKAQSSEDEERAKSSMSSSTKLKSKRKMKNKSSRKDDEKSRKRAKRSNKSPSRPNIYSSSTLFSHSDDDSQCSSTHPPDQKKKKLSSSSSRHPISSLASSNNLSFSGSIKSSDESHSEPENSERKKMSTSLSSSKPSKSYVSFSDQLSNHQPKYNAHNIYSDSDSSDADQQGEQHKLQPTHLATQKIKSKEKSTKLKSRKQPLFDSTDSSENEEPVAQPVNKEKKVKDKEKESGKSNKSRDRDKENKIKKRHRSHKSSSMKSRSKYYIPGEASGDGGSHITEKRESGATMEELFGPMTSSSDSDDIRESDHERPKTPTVVMTTPSSCDDSVVSKKSKSSRHHLDKSAFSLPSRHPEPHSLDTEESEISSAHPALQQSTPTITKSPEKKKKKHHKDKRSKRSSGHEGTPLSLQSSFIKQESSKSKPESVDYDALFNSPAASPVSELKIDSDYVPSDKAPSISPSLPKKERVIVPPVPDIAIRAPTPQPIIPIMKQDPEIDECEKQMRGMFSSDDDEDDEKLKITDAITDAIRASADEQDIDPIREIKEEVDPEWKLKEEEEKKLSCLVEQDKAIESIVLLERKSPTPQSTTTEDEVVKDDILPKDSATISQEETDVAVATILETLGVDEETDEGTDLPPPAREAKPLIVAPTLPVPAHSPPTLRIVEDVPKPAEASEANDEIASAIAAIPPPDNIDDTKDEDRDEPDPWTYDDNRSPKELQIDEGDVEEVNEEEPVQVKPVSLNIPTMQEKVQPASFEEASVDSSETKSKVEAKLDIPEARIKIPPPSYNHDSSSKAGDVYEFHDSDDDKRSEKSHITHTRQTPPMISPPAKSPVVQAPAVVSEIKIPSPPVSLPVPILQPQQTPQEPEKSQTALVVSPPPVVMSKPPPVVSKATPVAPKPPLVVSKPPPAVPKPVAAQPPLVATQPPLVATQPPLVATQPPLVETQPPLLATQPPQAVTQPPQPVNQPPLAATQPPLAVTQPPLTVTQPSLVVSQSPLAIVQPPLAITQPPVAALKPHPVAVQPPLTALKPPVAVQPPLATTKPPPVTAPLPLAVTKSPVVAVQPSLPVSHPPPPPVVSIPKPTPVTPVQVPPPPPVPVTTPTSVPTSVLAGLPPPPPIVTTVSSAVASVVSSVVSSMVSNMEPTLHTVNVSSALSTSPLAPSVTSASTNKGTPPPPPVATRSTIDEAIDEVIRKLHSGDLPFADSPSMPAPVSAQPAQRAGRRSRSRSKDSPDENASVTRMISRAEPQRHGSNQVLGVIGGHQVETQVPKVGKFGNSELDPNKTTKDNKLETLIDPQTGILTPMLHSDEGQYVPIMGQSNDSQGRLVQSSLHQMPQMHMANRQTPVISRIMERDPATTRASILEKHATPLLPHQQIPMTKHEGLTAMLAQQQRKSNEPPTTFSFQSQGSPIRAHMALSNATMQPSVSQPPPLSSVGGTILRAVSVSYAMPVHHSKVTTVVSSIGNPSPTGIPNSNNQGPPQPQSSFQPGHPPVSRGVFVATGVPSGVFQHQQPQILQLTTNKPPERQSPRPNSRHTPGPVQTPPSQGGKPELVHLPELPMQTTVTKINAGEEQQRKSAIMQNMPNVVLTSSPGSIPTGPPYLIRTVVSSPNSQIPMTQQQLQQHRTLQEAFLRSAEGGIRLTTGKDESNEHGPRPNEIIGMSSAQREMHGVSLHPSAHSPKPGRVPMPHEQLPTAHTNQQRGIPHRPAYETPGTDMRLMPGHGRLTSEGPHYSQTEHPPSFSPHYIPANIPNHIIGHQPPTFTMRHDKPGMPLDGKIQPMAGNDPKGPAMITVVERPPSHNVPPHLSSPHGNEQRNADSPSIGAVFPGQRQLYQTSGLPQQQHPTSQAISNMYAELDGRPFAHSPSYMQYDSRAISVAAAAAAAMEQERERPKGTSSPMDVPYRLRSPPSSLNSGEAGLQGDSLLLLLQRYPIMWQGLLALKNDSAAVQMHFVSGSMNVARDSLPSHPDGSIPPLRISQRMRLEPNQLDGVARKLQINAEHCMLLALPCGRDHMDVLHQSNNLRQGFITYLQLKQAAGIVNICHPDTQQAAYVIHIFPSCDFANENLAKIAPDLLSGVADIAHLLIVIATV